MDIVGKKLLGLQMMGFFIDRIIVPLKRREIELDLEEKERKREKNLSLMMSTIIISAT